MPYKIRDTEINLDNVHDARIEDFAIVIRYKGHCPIPSTRIEYTDDTELEEDMENLEKALEKNSARCCVLC